MQTKEEIKVLSIDNIELDAIISYNGKFKNVAILSHGITVSKDEGSLTSNLSDELDKVGFNTIRFSFRGHGKSMGTQKGITISGEMLDLLAVVRFTQERFPNQRIVLISASFGAVATSLLLEHLANCVSGLILWYPVLNLKHTFLTSTLEWGVKNFNKKAVDGLFKRDYLKVDDYFELGVVLFEEFKRYNPFDSFVSSKIPSLIVHGDKDSYVSYEISKDASKLKEQSEFYTIKDSDHGFEGIDGWNKLPEAIEKTVRWALNLTV